MPTARTDSTICSDAFVITNDDLPIEIEVPGVYIVPCDLQYKVDFDPLDPFKPFIPAIQILSNDVTIDFKGHTLSQDGCDPTGYGVVIGEGYFFTDQNFNTVYKNITLKNGTLKNFTGCAVLAFNATFGPFVDPTIVGAKLPYENLHFINLNILHNGTDSVYFDLVQGLQMNSLADSLTLGDTHPEIAFQGVVLDRVCVNESFCAYDPGIGAGISTADNVMVRDSQFNNTEGLGATGLEIDGNNIHFINSQANGTKSNIFYPLALEVPCNKQVRGCILVGTNIFVKNSQFNDSYTSCCNLVGCSFFGSNILVEDSQFNNCRAGKVFGLTTGGGIASVGLSPLTDSVNSGFKFVRCQMNGNSIDPENPSGDDGVRGIFASFVTDVEFVDCQIANHTSGAPHIGIDAAELFVVDTISFTRCTITNLRGAAYAVGIYYENSSAPGITPNLLVKDCIIGQIHSTSASAEVAGIECFAFGPTNFYAAGNRITDVHADPSNPNNAGIVFLGEIIGPVVKENVISDCQRGILLTAQAFSSPATASFLVFRAGASRTIPYGWQVDPSTYPANHPITNNQLFTNTRLNQTVSIAPDQVVRGEFFPSEDISAWENGDPLLYHVPAGGTPIQLYDRTIVSTGLNQVPYSGRPAVCFPATATNPNGSTAENLGNGIVTGINVFFTPDMVGGTIQIGNAAPVDIIRFVDSLHLKVKASPATGPDNFTVTYRDNGQLVDGDTYFAIVRLPESGPVESISEAFIQENDVTRCDVGIEDRRDCTASLLLDNVAFCNDVNYKINWCGRPPVACGNVEKGKFPKSKENLSVKCAS